MIFRILLEASNRIVKHAKTHRVRDYWRALNSSGETGAIHRMLGPCLAEQQAAITRWCARRRFPARNTDRGFTLLELLVVMVIIGLLAAYVGPRYFSQIGKSEIKAAKAQIDAFEKALDQYRLDVGRYPNQAQGLEALITRPANEARWDGPYLRKNVPLDPWGNPYLYRSPGERGEFDLLSMGKDGRPGGEGENADVTNW